MLAFQQAMLALFMLAAVVSASQDRSEGTMNPIRKVVTLLQAMQKKVQEEGEAEQKLYDEFMCYCKHGKGDLAASIETATSKEPAVSSDIETSEEKLDQSKADLKSAQEDRTSAKAAISDATALRKKEAGAFAAAKAEYDTNIAAINKAVAALEKGMTGSFLQTSAADILRKLAVSGKAEIPDYDRRELTSFLAEGAAYAPQSGEVTGILKEIGDEMSKTLAELTSTEEEAIKSFEALVEAKNKEIAALSQTVEVKTAQIGELGVSIVQMKEDLSDTQAALLEDKKYLEELETSCGTKTAEWEERSKTRAEELVALADTIKVLNDDDALDLFKKTLPSSGASLVQMRTTSAAQRRKALGLLRAASEVAQSQDRTKLELVALALGAKRSGGKGSFDKVITMIDKMVEVLKEEQIDDDHKKEFCNGQLDVTDDHRKEIARAVDDEATAIESAKESIATLTQEISDLEAGIKALDKSVAEATELRKAENEEYKALMASDSAAKDLLNFAKNRLNKFYNPALYKPPPKQELSEEEQIFVKHGGTPPPTEAPGGIAGTGVTVLAQISEHRQLSSSASQKDAPAAPPATWGAYSTKTEDNNGVIAMMDLLIKDLDKEMTEAETEEKEGQKDYEALMSDSAAKRAADTKALTEKSSAKAEMEGELQSHEESHAAAVSELMATEKYMQSLHAECDWLLQYFDVRKQARADEVDSLNRAKAVLNGADYSLLQEKQSSSSSSSPGFLERRK
mmetsp:Transcript_83167/g.174095  ORF Transcript_83167/g.174095 Transcript_83167/m.174095 type:complete len:741 (+) Transcript_83167:73-2295(+)